MMAAVFVAVPILEARARVPSFTVWGGLFAASCSVFVSGVVLMVGGRPILELILIRDANDITWRQGLALAVLAFLGLAGFIAYEVIVKGMGYAFHQYGP